MAETNEEQVDLMLRDFLAETLNPKLGSAERHFRQHLEAQRRAAWRQRAWLIGAFISGIAASVAVLWASPLFKTMGSGTRSPIVKTDGRLPDANLIHPVAEQVIQTRTTDEGVFMLDDNTPVRVVHRQSLEKTKYLDRDDGRPAQTVRPKDDLVLIKLTTY